MAGVLNFSGEKKIRPAKRDFNEKLYDERIHGRSAGARFFTRELLVLRVGELTDRDFNEEGEGESKACVDEWFDFMKCALVIECEIFYSTDGVCLYLTNAVTFFVIDTTFSSLLLNIQTLFQDIHFNVYYNFYTYVTDISFNFRNAIKRDI